MSTAAVVGVVAASVAAVGMLGAGLKYRSLYNRRYVSGLKNKFQDYMTEANMP
jgi:hypothetical protein